MTSKLPHRRDRGQVGIAGNAFNTTTIQDDDGSIEDSLVLNSQEDRAVIVLDIGDDTTAAGNVNNLDTGDIENMSEGQEASIEITTQADGLPDSDGSRDPPR